MLFFTISKEAERPPRKFLRCEPVEHLYGCGLAGGREHGGE